MNQARDHAELIQTVLKFARDSCLSPHRAACFWTAVRAQLTLRSSVRSTNGTARICILLRMRTWSYLLAIWSAKTQAIWFDSEVSLYGCYTPFYIDRENKKFAFKSHVKRKIKRSRYFLDCQVLYVGPPVKKNAKKM